LRAYIGHKTAHDISSRDWTTKSFQTGGAEFRIEVNVNRQKCVNMILHLKEEVAISTSLQHKHTSKGREEKRMKQNEY
jgi:hypothetical protein